MISVAVVVNDISFSDEFRELIERVAEEKGISLLVKTVLKSTELLKERVEYDFYFFDIDESGISGIELACELRRQYIERDFVFISSYENYARISMRAKPCAFLRKQYLEDDLREFFIMLERAWELKKQKIILKNNIQDYPVEAVKIMYINSKDHYLSLTYVNGMTDIIRNKMKVVAEQLRKYDFVRVNHSCTINLQYLKKFTGKVVIMTDGYKASVTDTYLKKVEILLNNWVTGKLPMGR